MYISGDLPSIANRLWSMPASTGDVLTGFIPEIQGYLGLGVISSGLRVELDYIARLKIFQLAQNPSGLAVSLLY